MYPLRALWGRFEGLGKRNGRPKKGAESCGIDVVYVWVRNRMDQISLHCRHMYVLHRERPQDLD